LSRLSDERAGLKSKPGWLRRLYDWVLHWAETPFGVPALFLLAFAESSFFPIPPDVLLIALALGIPMQSFRYAAICTAGSVTGGMLGYLIGVLFFDLIGIPILQFYGAMEAFDTVREMFLRYDVWFIGIAGFTPIPYKVFTIAAGTFGMNFPLFILVSFLSRGARFCIIGALIWKFGAPIKMFIDRYFNLLSILFFVLLALGFYALKFVF
jgi:membrane protein YqaA with SNARE-associated domain